MALWTGRASASAAMAACIAVALPLVATGTARADPCDTLSAKIIRVTGASIAGRSGPLAVFRAIDAERMSLECGAPRRMVFGSLDREPPRAYFALIGLAAKALTGARAADVEVLALNLHQDSLLSGALRQGAAGGAALRCETGPRGDGFAGEQTVCVLVPNRPPRLRRKAGLSQAPFAG